MTKEPDKSIVELMAEAMERIPKTGTVSIRLNPQAEAILGALSERLGRKATIDDFVEFMQSDEVNHGQEP